MLLTLRLINSNLVDYNGNIHIWHLVVEMIQLGNHSLFELYLNHALILWFRV